MADQPQDQRTISEDQRSIGELINDLANQTALLVRQELAIAIAELQEKGKRLGIGGGLFGAAAFLGFFAFAALVATAILGLVELGVVAWLAALIVAMALALVAGALALVGRSQVEQGTPPIPERAQQSVQRDVETVRERASR